MTSSSSGPRPRPAGTALVIEDDDALGPSMTEYLEEEGYLAHWVQTLAEARGFLATRAYDVLILDLSLAAEFGGDLLKELAPAEVAPATVVVSAFALAPIIAQRFDVELVRKPFDLDALGAAVAKALAQRKRPRLIA